MGLHGFIKRCFLFSCINFFISNVLQAQQFKSYHNSIELTSEIDSGGVLIEFESAYKKALFDKDTLNLVNSLLDLSRFKRNNLEYNSAFDDAGDALFLAEEFKDDLLQALAFEELGALSYLYKQDDEAEINFKKAHAYFKKLYRKDVIGADEVFQSFYNLALINQRKHNEKYLKLYIDSCYSLRPKLKQNNLYDVFLDEKLGSVKEWKGSPLESLELLKSSVNKLERLENESLKNKISKSFLIILYGRIGVIYMGVGQLELAKSYFNKSVEIDDVCGEGVFYKAFIYDKYADLLSGQGDYKKAFEFNQKANLINETHLNPRNDRNQGFLTVRNRYKDQLDKKNTLLNKQSLELAESKQESLRFRVFFFVVLFVFVVLFFLVRSRIRSLKFQKQKQDSKALLDVKNNELTVSTLQLIEREEVIKMLRDHVKKTHLDKGTRTLLKSIENRSVSLWDAFNNRFISQNEGFYERLQDQVPNLSAADLKICALIKLNFSGKEMAYLLGISLGSVHVARHRLRKKMNLSREINLTNFINSI